MTASRYLVLPAFGSLAMAACGGGGAVSTPAPPTGSPNPPPTATVAQGRYVGTVSIDGALHFADALFTEEGEARIYLGGQGDGLSGLMPSAMPASAAQFIGELAFDGSMTTGEGIVVGEGCAVLAANRFCGPSTTATIRLEESAAGRSRDLSGSLVIPGQAGDETWALDLVPWEIWYTNALDPAHLAGQYVESLAEYSTGGDTIVNIDESGRLFFQSVSSSCVGNGDVAPRERFGVADVSLIIENCAPAFDYLNGSYSGLATFSASDYWNYDAVLRTWLARSDESPAPAAITTWSIPQ